MCLTSETVKLEQKASFELLLKIIVYIPLVNRCISVREKQAKTKVE